MTWIKRIVCIVAIFATVVHGGKYFHPPEPVNDLLSTDDNGNINSDFLPCSYIIQFSAEPGTKEAQEQRDEFLLEARKVSEFTVQYTYDIAMNGMSIRVRKNCEQIQELASMSIVKNIWPTVSAAIYINQ
ncbi:hypothetical protein BDF22DRAFT_673852 [Syncephalis plumigaleata]|nr:hypothetical protein BDF22DRAFT_673852 [Syncephalis plumigaleata]